MKIQNAGKMLITTVCGWHTTYILSGKLRNQVTKQNTSHTHALLKESSLGCKCGTGDTVCTVINILVHYKTYKCSVWHHQNYRTLTDPLAHKLIYKRATHVVYTANLTNMHLYTTYLETEELEGHFRRFLNDPELLKRLQSPKIWKIRQKNLGCYRL